MNAKSLPAALTGRVSPAVMDAYLARLTVREAVDPARLAFLPSTEGAVSASPVMPVRVRMVALPLRGEYGWSLAVADTVTSAVKVLRSQFGTAGDGGIQVLAWAEALVGASGTDMPSRPGDELMVRLNLTVLLQKMQLEPVAAEDGPAWRGHVAPIVPPSVIRSDLTASVCVSDDTIDAYTALLQQRAGRICFMRCAEVKAWASARAAVRNEPPERRAAMEKDYMATVEECLAKFPYVVMPFHRCGHWLLVVISQPDNAIYSLDSMGTNGAEAPLVEACRWLALERCGSMRLEPVKVPSQADGVSCGIYALCFAEALVEHGEDAAWGEAPLFWRNLRVDARESRQRFARALLPNLPIVSY